jgi:23S rRNA (cytosine1962-C5)-methyltransferase
VPALVDLTEVRCVVARNDVGVRKLEGLPQEVRMLHGRRTEEVEIEEHGVRYPVRLLDGQKTGFYLDQRLARRRVLELARDRSVLDLFGYQGGFALAALAGGAREAMVVDQSQQALDLAMRAAEANDLAGLVVQRGNAFDVRQAGNSTW